MKGEASRNSPDRDGWARYRLGEQDVSTIIMGQSPDSVTYNASRVGLPFFQGKADFGLRHPVPKTWCSAPTRIAAPGDILISVRAPVGDVNIADEKCCIGRGIAALRPGLKAHGEFLFYCLLNYKPNLDALGSGAIFKAVNKETLRDLEIQLPPLPEQRAIAAVLSKIQAAVEVQEKIVATLKELKAATMAKLFREGLRGEPLKQTDIGEIPESWELAPLGGLLRLAQYGLSVRGERSGRYPILRMNCQEDGEVVFRDLQYIDLDDALLNSFRLNDGDLLFNRTNSFELVGRTVIFRGHQTAVFASYLIRLQIDENSMGSDFLNYYLNLEGVQAALKSLATRGVSQANISASKLKSFNVPIPSRDEQAQIVEILDRVSANVAVAVRRQDNLKSLFSSMLHLLMSGQVRVTRKMIALQALAERMARRPKWSGKVDEKVLEEVVKRIVEAVVPKKIILFGSAARGQMGPDSDLDLLVVKPCQNRREVSREIYRVLRGIGVPKDIVVVTPEDVEEYKDIPGMTIRAALREGKVLYAA